MLKTLAPLLFPSILVLGVIYYSRESRKERLDQSESGDVPHAKSGVAAFFGRLRESLLKALLLLFKVTGYFLCRHLLKRFPVLVRTVRGRQPRGNGLRFHTRVGFHNILVLNEDQKRKRKTQSDLDSNPYCPRTNSTPPNSFYMTFSER